MKGKHLIFFDGECAFCQRSVHTLIHLDKKKIFLFAPLKGSTANDLLVGGLKPLKNEDSMVLIENFTKPPFKVWIRGRGALRALFLIGGVWRLIGWLCYMPIGADLIYRLIAKHRKRFAGKKIELDQDRLLK